MYIKYEYSVGLRRACKLCFTAAPIRKNPIYGTICFKWCMGSFLFRLTESQLFSLRRMGKEPTYSKKSCSWFDIFEIPIHRRFFASISMKTFFQSVDRSIWKKNFKYTIFNLIWLNFCITSLCLNGIFLFPESGSEAMF